MKEDVISERLEKIFNEKYKNLGYELIKINKEHENEYYKDFKYDLVLKRNDEVIALIEAKYRKSSNRPTTSSLIAGFFRLIYEKVMNEDYANRDMKLILIVYCKKSLSGDESFRDNLLYKIRDFINKIKKEDSEDFILNLDDLKICFLKDVVDDEDKIDDKKLLEEFERDVRKVGIDLPT